MRHIITSSLVLLVLCSVLHAQTDPLPSWNDGPTKSAIVSFVDRVTKEGSPDFVKPADANSLDQYMSRWSSTCGPKTPGSFVAVYCA